MKRDMDLVREILLKIESLAHGEGGQLKKDLAGHSFDVLNYHLNLLSDAGLITRTKTSFGDNLISFFGDWTLTWNGHEFLDLARDDQRWEEARGIGDKIRGYSIDLLSETLSKIASQQVRDAMGGA